MTVRRRLGARLVAACLLLASVTLFFDLAQALTLFRKREGFEWWPVNSAPDKYPVSPFEGYFTFADGSRVELPRKKRVGGAGWGETDSVEIIGDERKPMPIRLDVTWLSLRERKFYQFSFDLRGLPLKDYFQQGFVSPIDGKRATYEYITTGFAPGGGISLWLTGQSLAREVGFFRAQEITIAPEAFIGAAGSFDAFARSMLGDTLSAEELLPVDPANADAARWSGNYRQRWPWGASLPLAAKVERLRILFVNGEKMVWERGAPMNDGATYAAPRLMSINWEDASKQAILSEITLDEGETFAAFQALAADQRAVRLDISIDPGTHRVRIAMRNNSREVGLAKFTLKTYR